MRRRLFSQFLLNYLVILLLTAAATYLALALLGLASGKIAGQLAKARYPASAIIKEDYAQIDASPVILAGGGVQIIDEQLRIVYSGGIDTLGKTQLSVEEFTDFLRRSRSGAYHYDIVYQPEGRFWLVVTFPTSLRIDLALVRNKDAAPRDQLYAWGVLAAVAVLYLLSIAGLTFVYSKITAAAILTPLRKLRDATRLLREGDYSVRVDLKLKNEFAELQDTFNAMADKIEREMALRERAESNRRRLVLDVSHDLKNPLAAVEGYADLCMKNPDLSAEQRNAYLQVISDNSRKADRLLAELLELSKLDSPEFKLNLAKVDLCEYLRQACGGLVPLFETAGSPYQFDIPEEGLFAMVDVHRMNRVFQNLADNAIRYNPAGTAISVGLRADGGRAVIVFSDDGPGIPESHAAEVFKPFVRLRSTGPAAAGGTGLGLSIAKSIVEAHGGELALRTGEGAGCTFVITLPLILG
jgi:signal transduction histidine kinase